MNTAEQFDRLIDAAWPMLLYVAQQSGSWLCQIGLVVAFVAYIAAKLTLLLASMWSMNFAAYIWCRYLAGVPKEHLAWALWPLPTKYAP